MNLDDTVLNLENLSKEKYDKVLTKFESSLKAYGCKEITEEKKKANWTTPAKTDSPVVEGKDFIVRLTRPFSLDE